MRRAVVDIGTNSTRLFVAEVMDARVGEVIERRTEITRLGAGVDADGRLSEQAMERVYSVLDEYRGLIDRHGVSFAVAVLTSAVRDAANGEEFASAVRDRWGLEPHVLSGEEEARLTFLGATSERDAGDATPTLVIDIGGGSTELVIGKGREMEYHVSNQAGVVRQTERHLHSDPPSDSEREALAEDVREILRTGVPESWRRAVSHAIAVAGTATSMASIAQELEPYDPDRVEGYVASISECRAICERLAALTVAERREIRGLHPDRAPTIVAGAIILLETLGLFGLDEVEVSEHDILRGAALDL
ncbi:MAG: Ppx/GppA family phosphatase [Solirubrobacterales bacterium]|nr:Ppx/GppA family phosphatase [Solirubrobacterales bacterium]MBV9809433.1 Ppx/GppA family phosphatase [Solirubrobacterales bacterium]